MIMISLSLIYSCSDKKTPKPTAPDTPTGLSLVIKSVNSITVKWNSSTNSTAYRLYRGSAKIYEGDKLEFSDNSVIANTSYEYTISAVNSVGESNKSAVLIIKTDELKPTIPETPTGLALVNKSINSITIKWNASSTSTSYRLYRGLSKIYDGDKLEFTDNNLTANTNYEYVISAVNLVGESNKSSILRVTTDPNPMVNLGSVHLTLGNPTSATSELSNANNYLIIKPQYALSYNNTRRHANWVSWELSKSWLGSVERADNFQPDATLPTGWYRVLPTDYTNSGFDRGHLCPSADRTKTIDDNNSTFLMTNIIPQSPTLNRESWAYLESYCRDIVKTGYKAYIISGVLGTGGEGSSGALNSIKGLINVPSSVYKIAVFIPEAGTVNNGATVLAVNMPNNIKDTKDISWLKYVTTPAEIERQTGNDFFSALPNDVKATLKAKKYDINNSVFDVDAATRTYNGNVLYTGPKGGCYYVNSNGNKTYVDRSLCGN